jgi:hypothetical protein
MAYGKIIMERGGEFFFEIDEPYIGLVSDRGVAEGIKENFSKIINVVKDTAESAHEGISRIPESARPDEFELQFGIKLSAVAGVVFARAGTEGNFQITLKWIQKNEPKQSA